MKDEEDQTFFLYLIGGCVHTTEKTIVTFSSVVKPKMGRKGSPVRR
jgi:hypothetical protein